MANRNGKINGNTGFVDPVIDAPPVEKTAEKVIPPKNSGEEMPEWAKVGEEERKKEYPVGITVSATCKKCNGAIESFVVKKAGVICEDCGV